jgi:prevent-host-death family protein
MGKLLNIIPVSDLRQDAAKVLKRVKDSREPLVITQRGRAAAVLLSVEAYEKAERDRELLRLLARRRSNRVLGLARTPIGCPAK